MLTAHLVRGHAAGGGGRARGCCRHRTCCFEPCSGRARGAVLAARLLSSQNLLLRTLQWESSWSGPCCEDAGFAQVVALLEGGPDGELQREGEPLQEGGLLWKAVQQAPHVYTRKADRKAASVRDRKADRMSVCSGRRSAAQEDGLLRVTVSSGRRSAQGDGQLRKTVSSGRRSAQEGAPQGQVGTPE